MEGGRENLRNREMKNDTVFILKYGVPGGVARTGHGFVQSIQRHGEILLIAAVAGAVSQVAILCWGEGR